MSEVCDDDKCRKKAKGLSNSMVASSVPDLVLPVMLQSNLNVGVSPEY